MAYEIVVPRLGLTMEEGRIVEWFKKPGETVAGGETAVCRRDGQGGAGSGGGRRWHCPSPARPVPTEPMPIGTLIGYILAPGEELPSSGSGLGDVAAPESRTRRRLPWRPQAGRRPRDGERKLSSPAARRRARRIGRRLARHRASRRRPDPGGPRGGRQPKPRRGAPDQGLAGGQAAGREAGIDLAELAAQKTWAQDRARRRRSGHRSGRSQIAHNG